MEFLKKMVEMFISKKKIIGWVAAAGFAYGAVHLGMEQKEFKEAVCGAPVIEKLPELPKPEDLKIEAPKPEEPKK